MLDERSIRRFHTRTPADIRDVKTKGEKMSDNSDLFEIEGDELVSFKAKDVDMDEVVVPDGVDIIGDYAFEGSRFKAV